MRSSAAVPHSLAGGVEVFSVADLSDDVRARLDAEASDFVVSKIGSRSTSMVIDASTADLLARFGEPSAIAGAVIAYSEVTSADPRVVLDSAYPILKRLISRGFLVAADAASADGLTSTIAVGSRLGDIRIEELVQLSEDVEVYRGSTSDGVSVAVKVARPHTSIRVHARIRHEEAVLNRLTNHVGRGTVDGRPFVTRKWHDGIGAGELSTRLRLDVGASARHQLRSTCAAIIDAYADLHRYGVVHGDVHPRNLIIGSDCAVAIIDFGSARLTDVPGSGPARAGVSFFFEPEYAAARASGASQVAATLRGEQYAIAALIYRLLTGQHYLDFYLDDRMWQQIVAEPPIPFARRPSPVWPDGERVLLRALAKEPGARYSDVQAFAADFRRACGRRPLVSIASPSRSVFGSFLEDVVPALLDDPRCVTPTDMSPTVYSGSAGVAYALYRLACIREDGALLAAADAWIDRALHRRRKVAFQGAFYEGESGLYAVRALVSSAQGDEASFSRAIAEYCSAAASVRPECVDAIGGRAGALIGASLLMTAAPPEAEPERTSLRALGSTLTGSVDASDLTWLGVAHGLAGPLYAALLWNNATGSTMMESTKRRLDELSKFANPTKTGLYWPQQARPGDSRRRPQSGWCHGSAGHALLWATAYRVAGDPRYLDTAERAARYAFDEGAQSGPSLCCGLTGQSYACLSLFRLTGADIWVSRARHLAAQAVAQAGALKQRKSLYTGVLGICVLSADLSQPEHSHLPLFEPDNS